MRISELWRLVDDEFGRAYGRHLAATHVLHEIGDRTVEQALEAGADPRHIWRALCVDMDVPRERWLGRDLPLQENPDRG